GMVKNLLSAIPIAAFRIMKRSILNGTTGAILIKASHLISNRIIKGFEACLPSSFCNIRVIEARASEDADRFKRHKI
ncbi:MAG: hypothetical protein ACK415_05050, partial [Thermodesulfovibrionales bacterium]